MHVAFTGSRHWTNVEQIRNRLVALQEQYGSTLRVCHGKSPGGGVDLFVEQVAGDLGIGQTPFPVRPDLDGRHRGAPLNRNKRMLLGFVPDLVIAFRSAGKSNGTDFTIKYAEQLGIPVETNEEETA